MSTHAGQRTYPAKRAPCAGATRAGMPCACPDAATTVLNALRCFWQDVAPCAHRETSASRVIVRGLECTSSRNVGMRGFFVISADDAGMPVCTHGDAFHLWVAEANGDWQFSVLSQSLALDAPAVYWMNTSAARMPGVHEYSLTLSLVETPLRALQQAEGKTTGGLSWFSNGTESPLQDMLRYRRCVWQQVPLQAPIIRVQHSTITNTPSVACSSMPSTSSFAYRRIGRCAVSSNPRDCPDNHTRRRILDTSNEQRLRKRMAQGFGHVLTSSECRLRWFGEAALQRCLAGRSVLNVGGADAVDVQRGFARINRSLVSWTQVRPGTTHPNVADFHRAFEKPWQQCFLARGMCDVRFGTSTVRTLLKRPLEHLLPQGTASLPAAPRTTPPTAAPMAPSSTGAGRHAKSRQEVLSLMCASDIVVYESGLDDIALPLTPFTPLRDRSLLQAACSGRAVAECAGVLPIALKNETWRHAPLAAYRNRLHALLEVWKSCRASRPSWRGIFKLAQAPRARALRETREIADCERAQTGYSAQAHHVAILNAVARHAVEMAGFEAFDPSAATMHASASWFDALPAARGAKRHSQKAAADPRGLEYEVHRAEAVSDMVTQMLLNQLCHPKQGG